MRYHITHLISSVLSTVLSFLEGSIKFTLGSVVAWASDLWSTELRVRLPVSHDKVSPMKNPPRGGNIILCKFLSPYANLAYPMTKSPLPLKFRRSRRYTIAPREVFASAFDRFLDDGMTTLSLSCVKPLVGYYARQRQRVVLQRYWSRSWMEQNNFKLVSVAHLHNRQWLDTVTVRHLDDMVLLLLVCATLVNSFILSACWYALHCMYWIFLIYYVFIYLHITCHCVAM